MNSGPIEPRLGVGQAQQGRQIAEGGSVSEPATKSSGVGELSNTPLAPASFQFPHVSSDPVKGMESLVAVKSVSASAEETQFRQEVQEQLIALAGAGFDTTTQATFTKFLEKSTKLPEDAARLTWVANKIWALNKGSRFDIQPLRSWFASKGMRVRPFDTLPANHPGFQIDRKLYRTTVREVIAAGGVIDRRTALGLLDSLKNIVDTNDLFWAKGQLLGRVKTGKIQFADDKTQRQFESFFRERLPGRRSFKEIGLEMRWLRKSGFASENLDRVKALLDGCNKDDGAIFYAERSFHREVSKALKKAKTPDEKARIEAASAEMNAIFEQRLDGKFDSYAAVKHLEREQRNGKIDIHEMLAMQAAAVTSSTNEEFAYATMTAQVQLHMVRFQNELLEAWSDMWETVSDNMSGDERDSHGRIIRTALEIDLDKRLIQRQLERLRFSPAKQKELSTRAWIRGSRQRALSAVLGETDPSRKASAEGALASADVQLIDLDPPSGPKA